MPFSTIAMLSGWQNKWKECVLSIFLRIFLLSLFKGKIILNNILYSSHFYSEKKFKHPSDFEFILVLYHRKGVACVLSRSWEAFPMASSASVRLMKSDC